MNNNQATARVVEALEASSVGYMLVGALSSNAYGIARSTNDADIVVSFKTQGVVEFSKQLGPDFRLEEIYQ